MCFLPVVNLTRCTISDPKSQNAFTNSVKWCMVFIALGDIVCNEADDAWFNVGFPGPPPPPPPEWVWDWDNMLCGSPWTEDGFDGETPTEWGFFDILLAGATIDNIKQ